MCTSILSGTRSILTADDNSYLARALCITVGEKLDVE
jgi:hypothetical protein